MFSYETQTCPASLRDKEDTRQGYIKVATWFQIKVNYPKITKNFNCRNVDKRCLGYHHGIPFPYIYLFLKDKLYEVMFSRAINLFLKCI